MYREPRKDGEWGKLKSTRIPRDLIARLDDTDRDILTMLGGLPGYLRLERSRFDSDGFQPR
jgi:hypothetical protein